MDGVVIQFALIYGKAEPTKKKAITSLSQAADPTKVRMSVRLAGGIGAPRDSMAMGAKSPEKKNWDEKVDVPEYNFSDDSSDG